MPNGGGATAWLGALVTEHFYLKRQKELADVWSVVPVGTPVRVRLDSGREIDTKTRSAGWLLSGHSAVIMLDGISGAYSLERVTRLDAPPQPD